MAFDGGYPLHIALAYLLFAGYGMRTLFVTLKLPGVVGVILSGFLFSHFAQDDIMASRDHLQQLSFFLVLLTAGFEISVKDLQPYMFFLALLPCTLEGLGLTVYAVAFLDYSWMEAAVLSTALFALGDGLVIPKMAEFGAEFPQLQAPRLVFTVAPLEASYALTIFGILESFADPAGEKERLPLPLVLGYNILRIVLTLLVGAGIGKVAGYCLSHRHKLRVPFTQNYVNFTNTGVEGFLLFLAVALAAFGLDFEGDGGALLKLPYSTEPMLQPELLVIVIGSAFAQQADPKVMHGIEGVMSGVWVFGQLILFSMLGSRTQLSIFREFHSVWPLVLVGLACRFIGVLCAVYLTRKYRKCSIPDCQDCQKSNEERFWIHTGFLFLASLPRATIQGALGSVPATERFFSNNHNRKHVQNFIAASAKIYIVLFSVVGSLLLGIFGRQLLEASSKLKGCNSSMKEESAIVEHGGYRQHDREIAAIQEEIVCQLVQKTDEHHLGSPAEDAHVKPRRHVDHTQIARLLKHSSMMSLLDPQDQQEAAVPFHMI